MRRPSLTLKLMEPLRPASKALKTWCAYKEASKVHEEDVYRERICLLACAYFRAERICRRSP